MTDAIGNIIVDEEEQNIYQRHGYENRRNYLEEMADEYDVPRRVVFELASILGASEDFDGLINSLEDAEGYFNIFE
jgi:hypothetical protein